MFCEWFQRLVIEAQVLTIIATIWSIIEQFVGNWEPWKTTYVKAAIGLVIPPAGYFLGLASKCWVFTPESFLPYLATGFAVALAMLAPKTVKVAITTYLKK